MKFRVFQPKRFYVREYWLGGIVIDNQGHIRVDEIARYPNKRQVSLDVAVKELDETSRTSDCKLTKGISIPVLCFHNLTPMPNDSISLLIPDIPREMGHQVSSLKLEHPFEIKTVHRGSISGTIVDINPKRIIILGNAKKVIDIINTVGSRLVFALKTAPDFRTYLRDILIAQTIKPLGTTLTIGGFGSIFAIEVVYIMNSILSVGISFSRLFSFCMAILSVLLFLMKEALSDKIVALNPRWAAIINVIQWYVFLTFILFTPLLILSQVSPEFLVEYTKILFSILIILCVFENVGQIYYGAGLKRRTVFLLWVCLLGIILLFLFVDIE